MVNPESEDFRLLHVATFAYKYQNIVANVFRITICNCPQSLMNSNILRGGAHTVNCFSANKTSQILQDAKLQCTRDCKICTFVNRIIISSGLSFIHLYFWIPSSKSSLWVVFYPPQNIPQKLFCSLLFIPTLCPLNNFLKMKEGFSCCADFQRNVYMFCTKILAVVSLFLYGCYVDFKISMNQSSRNYADLSF